MVTGIYVGVSSKSQDTPQPGGRTADVGPGSGGEVVWYTDHFTGLEMTRPGLDRLIADVRTGKVCRSPAANAESASTGSFGQAASTKWRASFATSWRWTLSGCQSLKSLLSPEWA